MRHSVLLLETRAWSCCGCRRSFRERFPDIFPHRRATEPFRRSVFQKHWDGISRSRLGEEERIGGATVERWFERFLGRAEAERSGGVLVVA